MKFRKANKADVYEIVKMIADDKLGKLRVTVQQKRDRGH